MSMEMTLFLTLRFLIIGFCKTEVFLGSPRLSSENLPGLLKKLERFLGEFFESLDLVDPPLVVELVVETDLTLLWLGSRLDMDLKNCTLFGRACGGVESVRGSSVISIDGDGSSLLMVLDLDRWQGSGSGGEESSRTVVSEDILI